MLDLVAKKLFLTKGIGVADDKLTSFEFALRQAGIAGTNIVLISSIFPPYARLQTDQNTDIFLNMMRLEKMRGCLVIMQKI